MTIQLKLIIAASLLLIGVLLAWYVQSLRVDNARLLADNQQLLAVNAANGAVIEELKAQRVQDEQLLQQWANDQERLKQLQSQINRQIQRELSNNEDFKTWAGHALPDAAVRLLRSANSN